MCKRSLMCKDAQPLSLGKAASSAYISGMRPHQYRGHHRGTPAAYLLVVFGPVVDHRPVPGAPGRQDRHQDATGPEGRACIRNDAILGPPAILKPIGGLSDVVTLSTGEKTGNERFFAQDEKRLARLQQRSARKRKGSKNREKARRKVARLHAHIADRRRDFQHKLSTRLIRENQAIYVESLAVKQMLQHPNPGQGDCRCGLG